MQNELKIIAHRLGYLETNFPENSIESLKVIFENNEFLKNCDGFEFDVVFTKDNIPVVIHDEFIDDVSNGKGSVGKYTLSELKNFDFNYRKSSIYTGDYNFKIVSLEEILSFFSNNIDKLDNKIIKVETKEVILGTDSRIIGLAKIFNKFSILQKNIVHLSYVPTNLVNLKKYQTLHDLNIIKSDLLCEYSVILWLGMYLKSIDNISFRLKTYYDFSIKNATNIRTFLKTIWNYCVISIGNVLNETNFEFALNRFAEIGIYVLNDQSDICKLYEKINPMLIETNLNKITITSDAPVRLKKSFNSIEKK